MTCVNLALTMSEDPGKKVVLVDCDFRRPRISRYLGLGKVKGLAEVIERGLKLEDALVQVSNPRTTLNVLSAGHLAQDIFPSFYEDDVKPVLSRLTENYDFVIVDNPPILPLADMEFLADLLDAIFLVVRIRKISKDLVKAALETMQNKNVLGLIVNGAERQFSGYSYYGYYSKYHQRSKSKKQE